MVRLFPSRIQLNLWFLSLCGILLFFSGFLRAESLQPYTILFPPFSTIDQEGELTGFGVEVFHAVSAELNAHEIRAEIIVLPLARARMMLDKQENAVVFALYPLGNDQSMHWVGPMAKTRLQIIGRPQQMVSTQWQASGLIGVEERSFAASLLKLRGLNKQTVLSAQTGGQVTQSLIKMLMTRRIDAFAATAANVRYEASVLGIDTARLQVFEELAVGELYFGFHRSIAADRVVQWQAAFDRLLVDGTLHAIYRKYASFQFLLPSKSPVDGPRPHIPSSDH